MEKVENENNESSEEYMMLEEYRDQKKSINRNPNAKEKNELVKVSFCTFIWIIRFEKVFKIYLKYNLSKKRVKSPAFRLQKPPNNRVNQCRPRVHDPEEK